MENQNQMKFLPSNCEKVMGNERFEVWIDKKSLNKGIYSGFRIDKKLKKVEAAFVSEDPKTKYRVIGINGQYFYSSRSR